MKKLDILQSIFGECWAEGKNYLFYCPKCTHHKPKLSINITKNVFKCWICGYSGSLTNLVRYYANNAQKSLWQEVDGKVDFALSNLEKELFEKPPKIIPQVSLPSNFISLTSSNAKGLAAPHFKYLAERGMGKKEIFKWRMGFCLSGQYSHRIIVPSVGLNGKVNYFIARNIKEYGYHYLAPFDVSRDDIIFNELDIDWLKPITLVEGVFDAVKVGENAIPLLDSQLNEKSKIFQEIIKNSSTVYVALDADAKKKENRLIKFLLSYDIKVYKIHYYAKDPAEVPIGKFSEYKDFAVPMSTSSILLSYLE